MPMTLGPYRCLLLLVYILLVSACKHPLTPSEILLEKQLTANDLHEKYEISFAAQAGKVYWVHLQSEAADLDLKLETSSETIAHVDYQTWLVASESIIYKPESQQQLNIIITAIEAANHTEAVLRIEQLPEKTSTDNKRIHAEQSIQAALKVGADNRDWNAIVKNLVSARRDLVGSGLNYRAAWAEHLAASITYRYIYDLPAAIKLTPRLISRHQSINQPMLTAQAQTLLGMSLLEAQSNDTTVKAKKRRAQAQQYFQQALNYLLKQQAWAQAAWTLNNSGLAYFYDDDYIAATNAYQSAIEYANKANLTMSAKLAQRNHALVLDKFGRTHDAIMQLEDVTGWSNLETTAPMLYALTHQELANLYFKTGAWSLAINSYSVSLEHAELNTDRARSMIQLAYAYLFTSNVPRAEIYYQLASTQLDKSSEINTQIALSRLNAAIAQAKGELENAINITLNLAAEATNITDKVQLNIALANLFLQSKEPDSSIQYSNQAINLLGQNENPYLLNTAQAINIKASLEVSNFDTKSAYATLKNTLQASSDFPDLELDILYTLTELAQVEADHASAMTWSEMAVEKLKNTMEHSSGEFWIGYFHKRREIHQQHIRLLLKNHQAVADSGDIIHAEQLIEDIVIKIDTFRNSKSKATDYSGDENQLSELNNAQQNMVINDNSSQATMESVENIRRTIDSTALPHNHTSITRASLSSIQQLLHKHQARLVLPWSDKNTSALFILDGQQITTSFAGSEADMENAINTILQQYSIPSAGQADLKKPLERLIPFQDNERYKKTYFIADSFLTSAPLSVLLDHPIAFLPSLSAILKKHSSTSTPNSGIAIFANPLYESSTQFSPLPGTANEATAILDSFKGQRSTLRTQTEVTRENLLSALSQNYQYTHIATHAVVDLRFPEASFLALSPSPVDQGHDSSEIITVYDIRSLDINTDLIVLSACQTNYGRALYGETTTGLPGAFIDAGAKAVLSSLWAIPDTVTEKLMGHFYQALTAGNDLETSLYLAQKQVRETPGYHYPYYWAGWKLDKTNLFTTRD